MTAPVVVVSLVALWLSSCTCFAVTVVLETSGKLVLGGTAIAIGATTVSQGGAAVVGGGAAVVSGLAAMWSWLTGVATAAIPWINGVATVLIVGAVLIGIGNQKTEVTYKDENKNNCKYVARKLNSSEAQTLASSKGNISISCFHVSCKSDLPKKDMKNEWNAIGIVLYQYNNKCEWTLNGIRCKSGYIIIIDSNKVLKEQDNETLHNTCFKMIFGQYPSQLKYTIIGGGFSIQKGECVYNSRSLNLGSKNTQRVGFAQKDSIHFGTNVMNPLEQKYIAVTVHNWINYKQQNTKVKDVPKENGNILCMHPNSIKKQ